VKLRLSSFRVRMFAVTLLIVVAVLAGVTVLGWSGMFRSEVQRLDERLCGEARRMANLAPPPQELEHFEADLVAKLRLDSTQQLLVALDQAGGRVLQSARWPAGLAIDGLDWVRARGPGGPGGPPPEEHPGADEASPDAGRRQAFGPGRGPGGGGLGPGRPPRAMPCLLATFKQGQGEWRAALALPRRDRGFVAADLAATRDELLDTLRRASGLVLPLALLLSGAGAWLLSSLALRPVTRLREAMRGVDGTALDRRLPVEHEDREFQALITAYNNMLERLEASFHQASRFSADAAHELRTPLTILRGQIERAIQLADKRAIQANLMEMLDEVGRLSSISRKLLMLSQADAGRLALLRAPLDFSHMLEQCVADLRLQGLDGTVSSDVAPGLALVGDAQLLGQLLNNLAGNAAKYTPPDGWIRIQARAVAGGVETLFSNAAPGVGPAERARFFERFFRSDAAHGRRVDGHGLGLSLSRVIARAHGGELSLEPGRAGEVVLRLFLPAGRGAGA
jgi:two-component system heavy metal sensor histidine kinase CusS